MTRRMLFASLFGLFLIVRGDSFAQSTTGAIRGTVTDPSGAVIPSASIVVTSSTSGSKSATSGADGAFTFDHLVPGRYSASITATGFAQGNITDIMVFRGKTTSENVTLQIPVEQQQMQVTADTAGVDTSADNNASAMVIKGKDLDALSDDPDELQNELKAWPARRRAQRRANLHRRLYRRAASAEVFDPRDPHQPESIFGAVRQAGLRPHRDSHQARHRQAPRHVHDEWATTLHSTRSTPSSPASPLTTPLSSPAMPAAR